jgi:hypothetical protein
MVFWCGIKENILKNKLFTRNVKFKWLVKYESYELRLFSSTHFASASSTLTSKETLKTAMSLSFR